VDQETVEWYRRPYVKANRYVVAIGRRSDTGVTNATRGETGLVSPGKLVFGGGPLSLSAPLAVGRSGAGAGSLRPWPQSVRPHRTYLLL
jgi:hypothetical protein